MLRTLGRLIMVPLGFILGTLAALAVLATLGLERLTKATYGKSLDPAHVSQIFDVIVGVKTLASIGTMVPALLVVIVGEVARIRAPLYYILGGGFAVAALPLVARMGTLGSDFSQIGLIWQVFATAGFMGGGVYWLIAGRRA